MLFKIEFILFFKGKKRKIQIANTEMSQFPQFAIVTDAIKSYKQIL